VTNDLPIDSEYNWEGAARSAITASQLGATIQMPDEVNLLMMLLSFLDSSTIRRDILFRGGSLQPRWSRLGEVELVSPMEAGINLSFVKLLSNISDLNAAIDLLIAKSFLYTKPTTGEARVDFNARQFPTDVV